jgi:hypothetical protein
VNLFYEHLQHEALNPKGNREGIRTAWAKLAGDEGRAPCDGGRLRIRAGKKDEPAHQRDNLAR